MPGPDLMTQQRGAAFGAGWAVPGDVTHQGRCYGMKGAKKEATGTVCLGSSSLTPATINHFLRLSTLRAVS